jgi:hypothetical protein
VCRSPRRVTARDSFGNVATGYRGAVTFTSTDAAATKPADYTFTAADNGAHSFTGVVFKTAGTRNLASTDKTTSSITGYGVDQSWSRRARRASP